MPLKPTENHAMFSLFLHKSLPTVSGDKVVRIHGMKTILAVGPESAQFTELTEAELQTCTKIDETFLCGFQHTWTSDPSTSCLAAIYFQNAAAIQLRCKVATESAEFTLERLNETSFVSVAQKKDDGANPVREPEVRAPTTRNTNCLLYTSPSPRD